MSTAGDRSIKGGDSGRKRKIDNCDDDDDDDGDKEVTGERKSESEHDEIVRLRADLEARDARVHVLEAENERFRMESEALVDETPTLSEEIVRLSRNDDQYIGTSALNEETGELTYRGGHLRGDDDDRDLILSVRICDYVKSIVGVKLNEDHTSLVTDGAFSYCKFITTVHLPEAWKSINELAFLGCIALKTIDMQHVTEIGLEAFSESGLTTVTISHGVTELRESTFALCELLTTVIIHNYVTAIEDGVFYRCPLLTNIRVPDACTVGARVFEDCTALQALATAKKFPNIESYLRYRYRLPAFVYPTLLAMNICNIRMAANGNVDDGIGANDEGDVVVGMYRRLKVVDLWRRVLEYVSL